MQTYFINKLLSLATVFLCIFLTLAWFGYSEDQWQAILIALIIFGYGHFILGFYYQLRGFLRKPQSWQWFASFSVLTIFSIGLAHVMFEYLGFVTTLFIGLIYFMFHGMLNEQTLVFRQTGKKVPMLFFTAFAIFGVTLVAYSVPHETFLFNRNLQFLDVNVAWFKYVFEMNFIGVSNFLYILWGGFSASMILLLYAWRRYGFPQLSLFLAVSFISILGLMLVFGPPAYVYTYLVVVGYHYMTWLLFYLVEMKRRGESAYRMFLMQNIAILFPFVVFAYLFFQPNTAPFVYAIFDYNIFVIVGYIHISTSFLNDEWMQSVQSRVFGRLTRFQ